MEGEEEKKKGEALQQQVTRLRKDKNSAINIGSGSKPKKGINVKRETKKTRGARIRSSMTAHGIRTMSSKNKEGGYLPLSWPSVKLFPSLTSCEHKVFWRFCCVLLLV